MRKDLFITTAGTTDSSKPLFQIPAFKKGANRFADYSPEKPESLLKFLIINIFKRLVAAIEDLPQDFP